MDLPPFKIGLVITNYSMLSFLIVLMVDHYKSNNNLMSWSSCFHFLCLIWLIIRGAFWLRTVTSTESWGEFSFYSLYWLPNPIQFGSFMLLPLFFTQILYPQEWKTYWVYVRPLYYLILLCLVLFQIIWAMLAAIDKQIQYSKCFDNDTNSTTADCFHTEYSSTVSRSVTSICFILLAFFQGIYAYKIVHLEKSYYQRYFILNPKMMTIVNGILVLSFLSKGIYQLFPLYGHFLLPDIPLQGSSDINVAVFLSFEIWEYIPTILLVLTVTSKALGHSNTNNNNNYNNNNNNNNGTLLSARKNNNNNNNNSRRNGNNSSGGGSNNNSIPASRSSSSEALKGYNKKKKQPMDNNGSSNDSTFLIQSNSNGNNNNNQDSSNDNSIHNGSSYGSGTRFTNSVFTALPQDDDIISVSSDSGSFSSSFEKSVQLLASQKNNNDNLSFSYNKNSNFNNNNNIRSSGGSIKSGNNNTNNNNNNMSNNNSNNNSNNSNTSGLGSIGRFEKPSSLNPKSSWLPTRQQQQLQLQLQGINSARDSNNNISSVGNISGSINSGRIIVSGRMSGGSGTSLLLPYEDSRRQLAVNNSNSNNISPHASGSSGNNKYSNNSFNNSILHSQQSQQQQQQLFPSSTSTALTSLSSARGVQKQQQRTSDQYVISLRQQMPRTGSLDVSSSSNNSNNNNNNNNNSNLMNNAGNNSSSNNGTVNSNKNSARRLNRLSLN